MRIHPTAALLAAMFVCGPVAAQETPKNDADSTALRVQRLVADLGNPDFKVREKATEELISIGGPALEAVRKAQSNENEEVKARAGRIIAAIEKASKAGNRGDQPGKGAEGAGDPGQKALGKLLDELMRGLMRRPDSRKEGEKEEGKEGGKDRLEDLFRDLDDFFGPRPEGRRGSPDEWREFWKKWNDRSARLFPDLDELRKWRERLEEELQQHRMQERDKRGPWQSVAIGNGKFTLTYSNGAETVEYARDSNGSVRLKVTGPEGAKTFEAASEEEFRKKHPDLLEKYVDSRVRGRFRIRMDGMEFGGGRRAVDGGIGLSAGPVGEILQAHLSLSPGQGFLVTAVEEGSRASAWGLRQYDIVLGVDGRPVSSLEALNGILEGIKPGSEMSFDIIRRAERTAIKALR